MTVRDTPIVKIRDTETSETEIRAAVYDEAHSYVYMSSNGKKDGGYDGKGVQVIVIFPEDVDALRDFLNKLP
jgi:hypothetical protein